MATRDPLPELSELAMVCEVEKPTSEEQRTVWVEAMGREAQVAASRLAGQFHLEAHTIHQLARMAQPEIPNHGSTISSLWNLCCINTRPNLETLAKRGGESNLARHCVAGRIAWVAQSSGRSSAPPNARLR